MPELPDYRTEPKPTPEGDRYAAARRQKWVKRNLDPMVETEPAAERHGWDRLSEDDRLAMTAKVIAESDLIGFWIAWHRAGGFAELERGGWDRSTIFRKVRRFRSYFGIHPDDARFPWLKVDLERVWADDRLIALEWADDFKRKPAQERIEQFHRWRPPWAASKTDPHDLEPEDPFKKLLGRPSVPDPVTE